MSVKRALAMGFLLWGVSYGLLSSGGLSADEGDSATGTVSGTVSYQADPERPWRFSRYYVKDKQTGYLAEAVVALDRRGVIEPAREPASHAIDQKLFQFTPESIAIRAGDSIRFTNSDEASHNVMATHLRHSFNITLPYGEEHVEAFQFATGIRQPYRVGCAFHGAMRCWIYVFDHPSFQLTSADGQFELRDVPPGDYKLTVVHAAGELRSVKPVTVKGGEQVKLEIVLGPDDVVEKKR